MGVPPDVFYDETRIAIAPWAFASPDRRKGADLAARKECAPLWRPRLMLHLSNVEVVLLVGAYAQRWHLGANRAASLTKPFAKGPNVWRLPPRLWAFPCRIPPGATPAG